MATIADKLNENAIKYRRELMMLPIIGIKSSLEHLTLRPGIQWKEVVGSIGSDAQLRPHDGNVNEQAGVNTDARELETFVGDVITYEDPEKLRKSILGEALLGNNKNLAKHPIEKLIVASVVKSVSKKLNMSLFDAKRNITDIKNSTTKDLFNGYDKITAAEIALGTVSVAKENLEEFTEAFTEANVVDMLMAFYQGASDELTSEPTKLFLPKTLYNMYNNGYKNDFGSAPYNKEFKKTFLEGTDDTCELVALPGKKDAPYIQLTTKKNMLVGVDQLSDSEFVKVREVDNPFKLQFVMKMNFGVQFESIAPELLKVGKLFVA